VSGPERESPAGVVNAKPVAHTPDRPPPWTRSPSSMNLYASKPKD
jgi:hypothetical protein